MAERLKKLGSFGLELAITFPGVRRRLLDGHHGDDVPTVSLRTYRLVYKSLPNATAQSLVDPGDSQTKSEARYLWEVWVRRMQDGAPLTITDPRTGADVNVKITNDRLSYSLFRQYLFESALTLEEYDAA